MDTYPGIPKCYDCYAREGCDADRGSIKCKQNLIKKRFKKAADTPEKEDDDNKCN